MRGLSTNACGLVQREKLGPLEEPMQIGFFIPGGEFPDAILEGVKQRVAGDTVTVWRTGEAASPDVEVLFALGVVDRAMMEAMPKLAFIQTLSDGYEGVDVEAATELGIRVSNSPGDVTGNGDSVAEYTILLMLGAARRLPVALASIHDPKVEKPGRGGSLIGSKVCIVGMGSIGAKIAQRLLAFGATVTGVDLHPEHAPKQVPTCKPDKLKEAVAEVDFVVLSVRASKENVHLVDAGVLSAMKQGAMLINIARGSLVDEKALYEAVKSGHLGGAGLDVEEHEPIPVDDPLLTLPQIFMTPHQAGLTERNVQGTVQYALRVLEDIRAGRPIASQLNEPTGGRAADLLPPVRG